MIVYFKVVLIKFPPVKLCFEFLQLTFQITTCARILSQNTQNFPTGSLIRLLYTFRGVSRPSYVAHPV